MAKRKLTMKVREMRDADVQWISLVNRPANRIPFRVTKNEGKLEAGMFHLNRMFPSKKSEKTGSSVAAFLIQKSDQETLLPRLKEAGFNTDNLIDQDGVLIVKQDADFNEAECVAVQLNERVGAMLSNVQKAFTPYREDSSSFSENLNKHGFYPSVNVAMGALDETVRNALWDAENVGEAASFIGNALEQFSGYIVTLVENLPEEAFTAMKVASAPAEKSEDGDTSEETAKSEAPTEGEKEEQAAGASKSEEGDEAGQAEKSEDAGEQGNEETSTTEKSEEESAEETQKSESDTSGSAEADDKGESASKSEDDLTKKMDSILEGLGNLTSKVDSLEKNQGTLSEKVESASKVAKAAQEAVEGTVSASEEDSHERPNLRAVKGDKGDFWSGTGLDSLFPK